MDNNEYTFHTDDHHHHHHHHHHSTGDVTPHVDVDVDVDAAHDEAAEAMLASLRAVINDDDTNNIHSDEHQHQHGHTVEADSLLSHQQPSENISTTLNSFDIPSLSPQPPPPQTLPQTPEKLLASLEEIIRDNQTILDALRSPGAIEGLSSALKGLGEGNVKLGQIAKGLAGQFRLAELRAGLHTLNPNIDPALAEPTVVLRTEYEDLKAKYDELLALVPASTAGGKRGAKGGRKAKTTKADQSISMPIGVGVGGAERARSDSMIPLGGVEGRKKRSIKLEHLVHKMANRRLGVEYPVTGFECKGSRDLPEPSSGAPTAETSINQVDEYRPDYVHDVDTESVKPFIAKVVEDVEQVWNETFGTDEPDVDHERIVGAVHIYWTRLVKRYDEQRHRQRGEVHRDELSRRKQNTYRRQQSLLARRFAAFDTSPLNLCRLRALYRTLLTIDFAAQTQDQPDPKRSYTADEWYAYRKAACGSRAPDAHEIIDQFWLSANARALLNILDVCSADQNAKTRRKGRPKQPNPTFHLPSELWDRSNLPLIRAKDSVSGLPIPGAQGLVLFRFHVDEKVQLENPEWALQLYDNPPIPEGDAPLPNLQSILMSTEFSYLRPMIKNAGNAANPKVLSKEEVEEINKREIWPDVDESQNQTMEMEIDQSQSNILDPELVQLGSTTSQNQQAMGLNAVTTTDTVTAMEGQEDADVEGDGDGDGEFMTFAALSRLTGEGTTTPNGSISNKVETGQSGVASAILSNPFLIASLPLPLTQQTIDGSGSPVPTPVSSNVGQVQSQVVVGPSPGSSMRARKLGKRTISEFPGGAATPVPKRRKENMGIGVALSSSGNGSSTNTNTNTNTIAGGGGANGDGVEGDLNGDAEFLLGLGL